MNAKESIKEQFGFTDAEARHIYDVFIKEKVLLIDKHTGQFTLSHGAFWDKQVMLNALAVGR